MGATYSYPPLATATDPAKYVLVGSKTSSTFLIGEGGKAWLGSANSLNWLIGEGGKSFLIGEGGKWLYSSTAAPVKVLVLPLNVIGAVNSLKAVSTNSTLINSLDVSTAIMAGGARFAFDDQLGC